MAGYNDIFGTPLPASGSSSGYDGLLSDPRFAIGVGLLSNPTVGAGITQGMGLLNAAKTQKLEEMKAKQSDQLMKIQLLQASQPQFKTNSVTGENMLYDPVSHSLSLLDPSASGGATVAPPVPGAGGLLSGDQGAAAAVGGAEGGLLAPASPSAPAFQPLQAPPPGLNPASRQRFVNAQATALGTQAGQMNNPLIGGAAGPNGEQVRGDEYLQTLPPTVQAQVKALAEGRMQFPSGFALKSPYWQQMLTAVSQYDPGFDAMNYNARANTRKDFTSGESSKNIAAINTAMAHLGSLKKSYDALGNTDYPTYNSVANYLGKQFGNKDIQAETTHVSANAEAVSHELAKVFRSTGMSEGEINAWKQKINTSSTPSESNAVIESALELMNGRMQALSEKYKQGMGTTKDPLELLSPEAQAAYKKLAGLNQAGDASQNDLSAMSDEDLLKLHQQLKGAQ